MSRFKRLWDFRGEGGGALDAEGAVGVGDEGAFLVEEVDTFGPVHLALGGDSLPDGVELVGGDGEGEGKIGLAGLEEADCGGFVPDDVVFAEAIDKDHGVKGVGDGRHEAAVLGAVVIGVPKVKLKLDFDLKEVGGIGNDADASEKERGPEIPDSQKGGGLEFAPEHGILVKKKTGGV